jgi:hypothetical protein
MGAAGNHRLRLTKKEYARHKAINPQTFEKTIIIRFRKNFKIGRARHLGAD